MHGIIHDPRAQATRCRRIAKYMSDETIKRRLERLAEEYEAQLGAGGGSDVGDAFMLRNPPGDSGSGERA